MNLSRVFLKSISGSTRLTWDPHLLAKQSTKCPTRRWRNTWKPCHQNDDIRELEWRTKIGFSSTCCTASRKTCASSGTLTLQWTYRPFKKCSIMCMVAENTYAQLLCLFTNWYPPRKPCLQFRKKTMLGWGLRLGLGPGKQHVLPNKVPTQGVKKQHHSLSTSQVSMHIRNLNQLC